MKKRYREKVDAAQSVVRFLTRAFFKIFNGIDVRGLDKIPPKGRLIVASNHVSNADPPVLVSHIGLVRHANILAKRELFSFWFWPLGVFLKFMGSVPVERYKKGGDISAFRKAMEILKRDECLVLFPEGTRAKGRKLKPKNGVAFLAHKTGALVLPAKIFNSENFSKLGKISIRFGEARKFEPRSGNIKKDYLEFSENLMKDIYSLKKEQL